MLFVNPKKKRIVEKVYRDGNALFLVQESGIIRIVPQTERMVRISYTENGKFEAAQGAQLADLSASCEWSHEECTDSVVIRCKELSVKIDRATGSIVFERPDGSVLLAEREIESKCVEQFDSYRMVLNENAKIEKVQTADGVKLKVAEAERVFDRKLYHTKLHLAFAEDEERTGEMSSCIRCGKCVGVCPMHLEPLYMFKYGEKNLLDAAEAANVLDCIECGACTYNCPARLHLVHMFRTTKQKINDAKRAAKAKADAEAAAAAKKEA